MSVQTLFEIRDRRLVRHFSVHECAPAAFLHHLCPIVAGYLAEGLRTINLITEPVRTDHSQISSLLTIG
jgi:hypothetical protein